MRPFRLLLTLICCVIAITALLYLSIADPPDASPGSDADRSNGGSTRTGLGALFSFHGPLFPPSAIISLTDDNSTFFLARPAAFGPLLPGKGLSGQLWIGSGFANDAYGHGYPQATAEGELGCSDVPGWHEEYRVHSRRRKRRAYSSLTYGVGRNVGARAERREAQRWERARAADSAEEQFDKERADIEGKVVLLSRGGCGFLDKVMWAQRRGGVAVIVGDNVRSGPIITMYARGDTKNVSIPALFTSRTTAHLLSTLVPSGETLAFPDLGSPHTAESKARPYQPQGPVPDGLISRLATEERGGFNHLSSLLGWDQPVRSAPDEHPRSPLRTYTNTGTMSVRETRKTTYAEFSVFSTTISRKELQTLHQGLWVTLTPTNMSSNPFLDTLLVLVVSPVVTLTVVYALLLLRSRMQRRRWRAPKSVVERLPVRTYHTLPASSSLATPVASSPTTPLLQTSHQPTISGHSTGSATPGKPGADGVVSSEPEKQLHGLAEWRRRYGGRQRECVVCLEEYEDGVSRVMSLPCGHEFHAECITPWLTTRRRTCPICKGDVVRSLARAQRGESPTRPSRRRRAHQPGSTTASTENDPASDDDYSSDEDEDDDDEPDAQEAEDEEDVQTSAAITRNDSPSAARPISISRSASELYDEDLEGGPASAPEDRPRSRVNMWRRVGSSFGVVIGGFFSPQEHRQQRRGSRELDRTR